MTLPTGKLPPALLRELLALGPASGPELLLGPAVGEDAAAIEIPAGVLIAATDPVTLTGSRVGAHAVWINANDVAVMGARPRWFLCTVLLPVGTRESEVRALFAETTRALDRVGAALVGGHTEVTTVVSQPLVVGQMLGLLEGRSFVATGGARPGDHILQVGAVPLEAGAVLATEAAARLSALSPELVARAAAALESPGISVVDAALLCADLGARALHDPTEGGLATGLWELAEAAGVELRVAADAVLWFEPARAICAELGADPWGALASGSVLAAVPAERAPAAARALASAGYASAAIATAHVGSGVWVARGTPLARFDRDEVTRVLA
jgi:hydrogenase expression/formation protein HypE